MRAWLVAVGVAAACLGLGRAQPDRAEPGSGDDWLERAQRHLAEREYHATDNGQGLQAPNRAHNLRTYFEKTGIRVHDRTAGGSPELLQLSLAAVGRGESLEAVAPGTPTAQKGPRRDPALRDRRVVRELRGRTRAGLHARRAPERRGPARRGARGRGCAACAARRCGDLRDRRAAQAPLRRADRERRGWRRSRRAPRDRQYRPAPDRRRRRGRDLSDRDRSAAHRDRGHPARGRPVDGTTRATASPRPAT